MISTPDHDDAKSELAAHRGLVGIRKTLCHGSGSGESGSQGQSDQKRFHGQSPSVLLALDQEAPSRMAKEPVRNMLKIRTHTPVAQYRVAIECVQAVLVNSRWL